MVFCNETSGIKLIKPWVTSTAWWAFFFSTQNSNLISIIFLHCFIISLMFLIESIVISCMWNLMCSHLQISITGEFTFEQIILGPTTSERNANKHKVSTKLLRWDQMWAAGWSGTLASYAYVPEQFSSAAFSPDFSSIVFLLRPSYHLAYQFYLLCLFSVI